MKTTRWLAAALALAGATVAWAGGGPDQATRDAAAAAVFALPVERDLWRELAQPGVGQAIETIAVARAKLDADVRALVGGAAPVPPVTPPPA